MRVKLATILAGLLMLATVSGWAWADDPKPATPAPPAATGAAADPVKSAEPAAAPAVPAAPAAAEAPKKPELADKADTAWMLVSCALVLFMTPGLAFFYGGLVGRKNILSLLMQNYISMGLVTILWVILCYSIAFGGGGDGGVIGDISQYLMLKNVGFDKVNGMPHMLFVVFQCMFAIITPALITGAFTERMKFSSYLLFISLWVILVYSPVCHWVWDGGALAAGGIFMPEGMGAIDLAGGTVVHINAGIAALVAVLVIGKRRGHRSPPHNLPLAVLGAGMLWFGWFGFNAGSAFGSTEGAVNAFMVTHVSAAAAAVMWALLDKIFETKPTMLGVITGAVAGLVAITPASGCVDVTGAIFTGVGASAIGYFGVAFLKKKLGYDDALDVFGVHGLAGIWGALACGLFASPQVMDPTNTAVMSGAPGNTISGIFYGGGMGQLGVQAIAVVVTVIYSGVVTFIILKVVSAITGGLRVSDHAERIGLDLTEHRESAYTVLD